MLRKILTKGYTEVPLVFVNFDYQAFKQNGAKGSCMVHVHPLLKNDEVIMEKANELVDYIRNNYDMNQMP